MSIAMLFNAPSKRIAPADFACDAVDGSSTGTQVPQMLGAVKAPRFEGAKHASDYNNRSGYREVGISGSRRRCGGQCCAPSSAQAPLRSDLLSEAAAVPDWYRSLRLVASLVPRAPNAWPHCAPDAAGLCEAVCEAAQER